MRLQGIDWSARVTKALVQIDKQATEFDAQLQHLKDNGALPSEVQRVAVEQLLDAIGAIVVTVHGLLVQAEQEVERLGYLWPSTVDKLRPELQRLPAAVAAVRRWGLEVPPELLSLDADELRSIPLAATDPRAGVEVFATVQRVIGALVVVGGAEALKHVAWVDFDKRGEPMVPKVQKGVWKGSSTISRHRTKVPLLQGRRQAQDSKRKLMHLDTAMKIYSERATAATGELVPKVLGDVAAYTRAKAAALAEPGADAAIAKLVQLTKQIPQPCGPPCNGDDDPAHDFFCDILQC
jgi:hypothetical protein